MWQNEILYRSFENLKIIPHNPSKSFITFVNVKNGKQYILVPPKKHLKISYKLKQILALTRMTVKPIKKCMKKKKLRFKKNCQKVKLKIDQDKQPLKA